MSMRRSAIAWMLLPTALFLGIAATSGSIAGTPYMLSAVPPVHAAAERGSGARGASTGAGADSADAEEVRGLIRAGRVADAEVRARAMLARAESGRPDSLRVARALNLLVETLWRGGRTGDPEARRLAERAVRINTRFAGPASLELAGSLNGLGIVLYLSGDLAGAIEVLDRALRIREAALGSDHLEVAKSLENLSILRKESGDPAGALPLQQRALDIRERQLGPNDRLVAQSLSNYGELLRILGDYSNARKNYERSVAIAEKVLGPDHPETATWRINLANVLAFTGDDDGARESLERAKEVIEKTLGPEHPTMALILNNLGELYGRAGDFEKASELLSRTLVIREKSMGPGSTYIGWTLSSLGFARFRMGRFEEADSLYLRSIAIWEKAVGPDHPDMAEVLGNRAILLASMGDVPQALALQRRVLAIREKALGGDHPLVATTLGEIAALLLDQGERARALDAALRAEAIGREHLRLVSSALSEQQALRYASVRPAGLDLALSQVDSTTSAADVSRVWDALVRGRALVLDQVAGRHRGVNQITRCAGDLVAASERLANLMVRGSGEDPELYRSLLDAARREREESERHLAASCAGFREEQDRARIGFDEVVRALPRRFALVSFARYKRHAAPTPRSARGSPGPSAVTDAEGATHYVALVHRDGGQPPVALPIGEAGHVDSLVARWSAEAGHRPSRRGGALHLSRYRAAGEALRRSVWDPIAPLLAGSERVLIVPDGALHLVNWATLPVGRTEYLVETGPLLHYLSAERDLVPAPPPARAGSGLLALGAPDFDAPVRVARPGAGERPDEATVEPVAGVVPAAAGARGARSSCADFRAIDFIALPAAAQEVDEVASLWTRQESLGPARQARHPAMPREWGRVDVLTGAGASASAFRLQAPGHAVLHVATHGFFLGATCDLDAGSGSSVEHPRRASAASPLLLAGLAFAGANHRLEAPASEDDGILTAEEVATMDLEGVDWAVLSACETGVGQVRFGEGVFGLRRAFQVAGARTLIMSLWGVEDDPTRRWMSALYDARISHSQSTIEAMRTASLTVLRDRRTRGDSDHPFHWGAFIAAGDWR